MTPYRLDDTVPVILTGLGMACVYSVWAAVLALLRWSVEFGEYGLTLWQIIAIYFAGGFAGGIIVALLFPLGRWFLGAIVVGYLGAMPFCTLVVMSAFPPDEWGSIGVPTVLLSSLLGAIIGGNIWYTEVRRRR